MSDVIRDSRLGMVSLSAFLQERRSDAQKRSCLICSVVSRAVFAALRLAITLHKSAEAAQIIIISPPKIISARIPPEDWDEPKVSTLGMMSSTI